MVHAMTAAPTDAAMTMRIVTAACGMPAEDEVELCVGVGALLLVRYKMDWVGVVGGVSLVWGEVWGVLDEELDVEDKVLEGVDDAELDWEGWSPLKIELNRPPPPEVEGLADAEADPEVVGTGAEFAGVVWATDEVGWVSWTTGEEDDWAAGWPRRLRGDRFLTRRPRSAWSRRWWPKVSEAATANTKER
jgi:hypothetical protein